MSEYSIDIFQQACGATRPLQLSVEHPDGRSVERRIIRQPFALIGRDPLTDVPLDDDSISQRHVYLQVIEGRVFCLDLMSRTGTRWNGGGERSGWISPGQSLHVGPYVVRLLDAVSDQSGPLPEASPLSRQSFELAALPMVTLEFTNSSSGRPPWRMNRRLALMGKSPDCKVQLSGRRMSRCHAALVCTPAGLWTVDLLGRDGLHVNDVRVRSSRIDNGDEVQLGRYVVRFYYSRPPADLRPEQKALLEELDLQASPVPEPMATDAETDRLSETPGTEPAPAEADPEAASLPVPATSQALATLEAGGPLAPVYGSTETLPALTAGSELVEPVPTWLVGQMGQMQQQMFDQFRQAFMMMVEMFTALHRDQMGLIREELDRLRSLSQELQTLQGQLTKRPASVPAVRATGGPPAKSPQAPQQAELLVQAKALLQAIQSGAAPPAASKPPSRTKPSTPTDVEKPRRRSEPARPAAAPPKPAETPLPQPPQEKLTDEEIHARLCQRIAAIQQEQQGLWQRILQSVVGKPSGENLP